MTISRWKGESDAYRDARDELKEAEIALKKQVEQVAQLRRSLPLEPVAEDYVFEEGPRELAADGPLTRVALSELFENPDAPLVLIHFMYGKAQEDPCPMCTLWAEGYNGQADHIRQWGNLAVAAAAPVSELRAFARERGWTRLRLLSTVGNAIKRDFEFESEDGSQWPGVSVFKKVADGTVRHFYSGSAIQDMEAGEFRGLDLLCPLWNMMDLTPDGRGDWNPSLSYD